MSVWHAPIAGFGPSHMPPAGTHMGLQSSLHTHWPVAGSHEQPDDAHAFSSQICPASQSASVMQRLSEGLGPGHAPGETQPGPQSAVHSHPTTGSHEHPDGAHASGEQICPSAQSASEPHWASEGFGP